MPRHVKKTRAKGWILKNTRIGPVLDIKICHQKDRYSVGTLVESLFRDTTASWVRIVNGIDKYVAESMETKEEEEHGASGRPVAKARTTTEARSDAVFRFYSYSVTEDGQTLKHNDHTIKSALQCQKT